ncbi:hypothetical protein A4X13_0g9050 [Tilletia indica]|uniref:Uncharacterized protein n=1 Tax=Tilletia indica TaxID=43049 RepID=A0A8T8SC26_9BASI|nr:hypothetical protein A4X13_0g9050 [Tilletia indica]
MRSISFSTFQISKSPNQNACIASLVLTSNNATNHGQFVAGGGMPNGGGHGYVDDANHSAAQPDGPGQDMHPPSMSTTEIRRMNPQATGGGHSGLNHSSRVREGGGGNFASSMAASTWVQNLIGLIPTNGARLSSTSEGFVNQQQGMSASSRARSHFGLWIDRSASDAPRPIAGGHFLGSVGLRSGGRGGHQQGRTPYRPIR